MAGFDPSLDKELFGEAVQIGTAFKLKVSVMSYNEGMAKLQISRERINKDGSPGFAKLGRLTLDELNAIFPLIKKAKEFMEKN
jgi:hypothetical protein